MQQHDEEVSQTQITELVIDATLADSFPASDPPAWTLGIEPQTEHTSFSRRKEGDEIGENAPDTQ